MLPSLYYLTSNEGFQLLCTKVVAESNFPSHCTVKNASWDSRAWNTKSINNAVKLMHVNEISLSLSNNLLVSCNLGGGYVPTNCFLLFLFVFILRVFNQQNFVGRVKFIEKGFYVEILFVIYNVEKILFNTKWKILFSPQIII